MVHTRQLITADELFAMSGSGAGFELVRGELRPVSPGGGTHGRIAAAIARELGVGVAERTLGSVFVAETGFRIGTDPDTVRAADVAFVANPRGTEWRDETRFLPGAPDLAVEVISPNDRYSDVQEKVAQWLAAGTRLVLVVDPRRREVVSHRGPREVRVLSGDDAIDGGDVVPGWRLPLAIVFGWS
ncbi:MAG: Uma2 family endonuclease [Planctomycetes bacterium]|nr:Uma2 family endonuclease [Planctomycetota bacterium]